jgi:hypothetical protein
MSDPPSQITADFTKAIRFTAYHTLATALKEATEKKHSLHGVLL